MSKPVGYLLVVECASPIFPDNPFAGVWEVSGMDVFLTSRENVLVCLSPGCPVDAFRFGSEVVDWEVDVFEGAHWLEDGSV